MASEHRLQESVMKLSLFQLLQQKLVSIFYKHFLLLQSWKSNNCMGNNREKSSRATATLKKFKFNSELKIFSNQISHFK